MHKRYTLPVMMEHWSEQSKFDHYLRVELAVLQARAQVGAIPQDAAELIAQYGKFTVERIEELDEKYQHDLIAFVVAVQESLVGTPAKPYKELFHQGMTSYDTEDPALVLMLRRAVGLILTELQELHQTLSGKAKEYQWTLMIARTHGQSAQPSTFGHYLAVKAQMVRRSIQRLEYALKVELTEAKISGAVGNYGTLTPEIEAKALRCLGLRPAAAETQILQRDRHATVIAALAVAAATMEDTFRTFHGMMRNEVGELQEPRKQGQRGSSAMPHKRNPHKTEQLIGLARLMRSHVVSALENVASLDWRDISHSSVERHILPDATSLVHYMAQRATRLIDGLVVFPERMKVNLERTQGVWATQHVQSSLMNVGIGYNDAYTYVQQAAFMAVDQERPFIDILRERPFPGRMETAAQLIGEEALEACFDAQAHIRPGIEHIFSSL